MNGEIVLLSGCPGAGKSTLVSGYPQHVRLNRDLIGGTLAKLARRLNERILSGETHFVLDNTFADTKSRRPFVEIAHRNGIPIHCVHLDTGIEDATVNIATRMWKTYGRILGPDEISAGSRTDPNLFPPIALFAYFKRLEMPAVEEGFASVRIEPFVRKHDPARTGKALLLDYDDTLRRTKSGRVCPWDPDDIEILPNRRKILLDYRKRGYKLLGISNQGDVGRNRLSLDRAKECFERTNKLLRLKIDYKFCPHQSTPVVCYCRKPMPGIVVGFIEQYGLNPSDCILVGDMVSDEKTAARLGIAYAHPRDFFGR